jgi:hypothetical protein
LSKDVRPVCKKFMQDVIIFDYNIAGRWQPLSADLIRHLCGW